MKPSTILRRALELFGPNGEKWVRHNSWSGDTCCALNAIGNAGQQEPANKAAAKDYLAAANSSHDISDWSGHNIARWNDTAESFDVIRVGFNRAIALA